MAVYNGEPFVREAVGSILNQTFKDFEFIIVDDVSTDGTPRILNDFAKQDARVKIFRNPKNMGQTRSLNRGFAESRGVFIARQDADDCPSSYKLEQSAA